MKRTLATLISLLCLSLTAWADAAYTGHFKVNGLLNGATKFELCLSYYGDGPCIVVGETVYHRKNGTKACIPVYGSWDIENSGHVHLYEMDGDVVCGNFDFDYDPDPDAPIGYDDTDVEGAWSLDGKTLPFTNAIAVSETVFPDYCNYLTDESRCSYLRYIGRDWSACSGTYGYELPGPDADNRDSRFLTLEMRADSTTWNFSNLINGDECIIEAKGTGGFGHSPGVNMYCWRFTIGNAEFDCVALDNAVLVYRTNPEAVPDGAIPDVMQIEGIYPRFSQYGSAHLERLIRPDDPESKTYCSTIIQVPYTTDAHLNDVIKNWVCTKLGSGSQADSYPTIAYAYSEEHVGTADDNDAAELDMDEAELYAENWQIPFYEAHVSFEKGKNYINLCLSGYDFLGGAHGFPYDFTQTIDRRTYHVMEWNDWFTNPNAVRRIVADALLEQNDADDLFDPNPETLPLPDNCPYFSKGNLIFEYQHYEIAPYSSGMPACSIPAKRLMPFLTPAAKALVK